MELRKSTAHYLPVFQSLIVQSSCLIVLICFSVLDVQAQDRGVKPIGGRPVRPPMPPTGFDGLLQNPNNSSNTCKEGPIDLRFFTSTSINYERDRNSNDKWISKKEVTKNNTVLNLATQDNGCDTVRDYDLDNSTGAHSPQWYEGVGDIGDACAAFGAGSPIPTDGFAKPHGYNCEKLTPRGREETETSAEHGACKTDRSKSMKFTLHTNNKYYISYTYASVNSKCVLQCVCAK